MANLTVSSTAKRPFKSRDQSGLERDILNASLAEFRKKGYHQSSVDDIADKLKIGKGTIYRHFGNKLLLFLSTVNFFLDQATDAAQDLIPVEDFGKAFSGYLDQLVRINSEMGEFLLIAGMEEGSLHMQKEMKKDARIKNGFRELVEKRRMGVRVLSGILDKGKVQKRIAPGLKSDICAEIIVSSVNNFIREYYSSCALNRGLGLDKKYELERGLAELKKFIANGLGISIIAPYTAKIPGKGI